MAQGMVPGMKRPILLGMLAFLIAISFLLGASSAGSANARGEAKSSYSDAFSWSVASSPVTGNLNSIDMVSVNDGWAVGDQGLVLHFDGKNWTAVNAPVTPTTTLHAVAMSSADNGWAIGMDETPPYDGIIIRWNGNEWAPVALPSPPWPFAMADVSAPNDASAWIAGGFFVCSAGPACNPEYALGIILHWNGSAWDYTSFPNLRFSAISMLSDTDGWVVGLELVQPTHQLRSCILHWNGSAWTAVAHPLTEYPGGSVQFILEEVAALNSNTVWTAISGQNRFLRWDGTSWTAVDSPISGRPSIAVLFANDAWAVGGEGDIGHWDGNTWALVPSPVSATLNSVSMVSPFEGWAVGNGGVILRGQAPTTNIYLPCIRK